MIINLEEFRMYPPSEYLTDELYDMFTKRIRYFFIELNKEMSSHGAFIKTVDCDIAGVNK